MNDNTNNNNNTSNASNAVTDDLMAAVVALIITSILFAIAVLCCMWPHNIVAIYILGKIASIMGVFSGGFGVALVLHTVPKLFEL
jgi:hypothetical protein